MSFFRIRDPPRSICLLHKPCLKIFLLVLKLGDDRLLLLLKPLEHLSSSGGTRTLIITRSGLHWPVYKLIQNRVEFNRELKVFISWVCNVSELERHVDAFFGWMIRNTGDNAET